MGEINLDRARVIHVPCEYVFDAQGMRISVDGLEEVGFDVGRYFLPCVTDDMTIRIEGSTPSIVPGGHGTASNPLDLKSILASREDSEGLYYEGFGRTIFVNSELWLEMDMEAGQALRLAAKGPGAGHGQTNWIPIKASWQGLDLAMHRKVPFVAPSAGRLLIRVTPENGPCIFRIGAWVADATTGAFDGPLAGTGGMWRRVTEVRRGDAFGSGGTMSIYDADFRFVGRVESGAWYAPGNGRFHILSTQAVTEAESAVRPKQLVYLDFGGGFVGYVPGLDLDLGTLDGFDSDALDLSANFRQQVLSRIREKFDNLPIRIVDFQPESLPYAKIYVSGSTPVEQMGEALGDGLNANLYNDAYIFAGNILDRLRSDHDWDALSQQARSNMLSDALANVSAAYLGRALGLEVTSQGSDLMALETWDDLAGAMEFSDTEIAVSGMAYLQNARHVLAAALSSFTPGVVQETHRNDFPDHAEAVLLGRDVDRPLLMGAMSQNDVDYYAFTLAEAATLQLRLARGEGTTLEIRDQDLFLIAEDADGDGQLVQQLQAGTYFVRLSLDLPPTAPPTIGDQLTASAPPEGSEYLVDLGQMGDATGDGTVDDADRELVLDNWLADAGRRDDRADINSDGQVDIFDLLAIRSHYQQQLPLAQNPDLNPPEAPMLGPMMPTMPPLMPALDEPTPIATPTPSPKAGDLLADVSPITTRPAGPTVAPRGIGMSLQAQDVRLQSQIAKPVGPIVNEPLSLAPAPIVPLAQDSYIPVSLGETVEPMQLPAESVAAQASQDAAQSPLDASLSSPLETPLEAEDSQ